MENTIILYQRVENLGRPVCRLAVEYQDKVQRILELDLTPRDADGLEQVLAYLLELAGKDKRFRQMKAAVLTSDAPLVRLFSNEATEVSPHTMERLQAVQQAYAGFELVWVDPVLIDCALQGEV